MRQWVRAAASPHTFVADAGLGALAGAFHTAVMKRLRASLAGHRAAQALWDACRLGEIRLAADTHWWQPEIGVALKHLGEGAMLEAVMQVLLSLHACGMGGSWSSVLDAPERFSMGGHVFELDGAITVQASAQRLDLARADLPPLVFLHGPQGWRLDGEQAVAAAWRYAAPVFLQHDSLSQLYLQRWDGAGVGANAQIVIDWPRKQSCDAPGALDAQARALVDAARGLRDADGRAGPAQ